MVKTNKNIINGKNHNTTCDSLLKGIENGTLLMLNGNDSFQFTCARCGECCRNRDDILLNPFDIFKMSRQLKMEPEKLVAKYCVSYIGNTSKIPLFSLRFREDENGQTTCPFLRKKDSMYGCRIHDAQPFVCTCYPLGRLMGHDKNSLVEGIKYVNQEPDCEGGIISRKENIIQNVDDWLGGKEKQKYETEFATLFYNFIVEIKDLVNLTKLNNDFESRNEKKSFYAETWYKTFEAFFYLNVDMNKIVTDEQFIKQFKQNLENIRDMIKSFKPIYKMVFKENL